MIYTIITENDESQWNDSTGVLYHFPKRYLKYLSTGTQVIYYKGALRNKKFSTKRLSDAPHYFGIATIGHVYPDRESQKGDMFAIIENYQVFNAPIFAKSNDEYLEKIPKNQETNYWRNGVRPCDKDTYNKILSTIANNISEPQSSYIVKNTELEDLFTSLVEGDKKLKFVVTYERNPKLKKIAQAIHGPTCFACGFNFYEFYGEYAKNFIHIHHIKPISELTEAKAVNPETDLIPLCANCHSVVHRRKDKTLSLDELKHMIEETSKKSTN